MKLNARTSLLLAAALLAAAGLALIQSSQSARSADEPAEPRITKTSTRAKAPRPAPESSEPVIAEEPSPAMPNLTDIEEENANLEHWKRLYNHLIAETGDPQRAIESLRAEIDTALSQWVAGEIQPVAALPPEERYDKLDLIRQSVAEGAAAIFEFLGLPGGHHLATAANALDLVAAEIQYAETAPDPASRLALLKLDRERQNRLDEVVLVGDAEQRALAEQQLEAWYSEGLAKVFPDDAIAFEAP